MHLPLTHENFASLSPTLGDLAIKGGVLMTFAMLAAFALSKGPAARRHLLWVLALSATLAIPALSALAPGWQVRLPDRAGVEATHRSVAPDNQLTLPDLKLQTTDQPAASVTSPTAAGSGVRSSSAGEGWLASALSERLPATIVEVWLCGTAFFLGAILLGNIAVWRLGRRAEVVVDDGWLDLLAACSRQMGIRRAVTLLRSKSQAMPMTWGILSPKVLIPACADAWTLERRWVVLTHELAHIQRLDCLSQLIAQLTRAIHWFNPLCWWANRQLTVERELACDDTVLSRGTLASDYAEQLLAVAAGSRLNRAFPVAAVAMARPSKLGGRLISILDPQRSHNIVTTLEKKVLIALTVLVMVPMALLKCYGTDDAQIAGAAGGNTRVLAADLPPIGADAQMLVRIDLKKCSPEQLKAAAKAVLGDKSDLMDEPIESFRAMQEPLVKHGANVIWLAETIAPATAAPIQYVALPANDDGSALAGDLKKTMRNPDVVKNGTFLVVREGMGPDMPAAAGAPGVGAAPPAPPAPTPAADANRRNAFAGALGMAGRDSGFILAVVPDAAMRVVDEKETNAPFPIIVLQQILRASDSLTLSANVSGTPSILLKISCADDTKSKFVSGSIDQGLAALATLLLPMKQHLAQDASPESQQQSMNIGALADQLQGMKSTADKKVVELALDGNTLASMGKGLVPLLIDARQNASEVASMNHMRQLILGIITYADGHNGQWPDKLEDIKDSVGGEAGFKQIISNPVTGEANGYLFEKPDGALSTLKKPSETVILYELKDGKKLDSGFRGYADGHVQRKR